MSTRPAVDRGRIDEDFLWQKMSTETLSAYMWPRKDHKFKFITPGLRIPVMRTVELHYCLSYRFDDYQSTSKIFRNKYIQLLEILCNPTFPKLFDDGSRPVS